MAKSAVPLHVFNNLCLNYDCFFRMKGDSGKDKMKKWSTYAHAVAWILPVIFCFIVVSFQKIDGYQLSGFCHISMIDRTWIISLDFIPQCLYIILYAVFVLKFCLELNHSIPKSKQKAEEIKGMMKNYGSIVFFIGLFKLVCGVLMLLASFYQQNWNEAKKDFILCQMQSRQR